MNATTLAARLAGTFQSGTGVIHAHVGCTVNRRRQVGNSPMIPENIAVRVERFEATGIVPKFCQRCGA